MNEQYIKALEGRKEVSAETISTLKEKFKDKVEPIVVKEKVKNFDKMTASEKWALVEKALRDLGYVE